MAKTVHPKDLAKHLENSANNAAPLLDGGQFTLNANPDRNDAQASMTYLVDANNGIALGSHGETKGYAKETPTKSEATSASYALYTRKELTDQAIPNDASLQARQVGTYQADKMLGLNSVVEERFALNAQGKPIAISIQADGCNINSNRGVFQVDCKDPRIQRGLSDLEVSDFITGQLDRHPGNIFIDPTTGKVTGIDNDRGFPHVDQRKLKGEVTEKIVGMPKMMHAETRDKILAADPEKLRKVLSTPPPVNGPSPLSKESIDGAVNRLKELQAELQKPNGNIKVVKAFDDNTYQEAVGTQEAAFKKILSTHASQATDQRGFKEYPKMSAQEKAQLAPEIGQSYTRSVKTSYLGAVELEMAKNKIAQGNYVQAEHQQFSQASRTPQAALEKQLAEGYAKMSNVQRKTFDATLAQLNKLESQLDTKLKHLDDPSVTDRFKSLFKGEQKVHDTKEQHAHDLADEVNKLKDSLRQSALDAVGIKQETSHVMDVSSSSKTPSQDPIGQKVNGALSESEQALQKTNDIKPRVDMTGDTSPEVGENKPSLDHHSVREQLGKGQEGHHANTNTKLAVDKNHRHSVREDTGLEAHHEDAGKNKVRLGPHQ